MAVILFVIQRKKMKNWNPKAEWIAGKLCEGGLLEERYDEKSGELKRKLTEEGKKEACSLLSEVEWRRWMAILAFHFLLLYRF